MSHTSGPWEACSNLVRTTRGPDGCGGFLIAECPANVGDRVENARLIAAAPDLLDALRACIADADGYEARTGRALVGGWPAKARAAIAKAAP